MPSPDRVDRFLSKWKAWIAFACCCLGALRVLIFAAGFPLFNPVDEPSHYGMVYEYSRGVWPQAELLKIDPEMARIFSLYGTDEYLISEKVLQQFHRDVPLPALTPPQREFYYPRRMSFWLRQSNIETQAAPMYYLVASAWYRAGQLFGLRDWGIAYWTRFLNAALYGAFIWVAFLFTRTVYPQESFLFSGVPLLLAVYPQDIFYGVNRDVLSPLLTAAVLLLLFRSFTKETGAGRELIAAGALTGAAFLTEVSNVVLFGALLAVLLARSKSAKPESGGSEQTIGAASLLAALSLPLAWMARNRVVAGDFTATQGKTFYLGWVVKPWSEMWQHPIFTFAGSRYFLRELVGSFWRGEFAWAGQPLRNEPAEIFYRYSTLLFLACFLFCFFRGSSEQGRLQRWSGGISLYLTAASVMFLAVISLFYDFQQCPYPSRVAPYFVSGRIIIGALLPFSLLYLGGMQFLLKPLRNRLHPILVLLPVLIGLVLAETRIASVVFHSRFNFYALLRM